jgi:hypothetical protein
MITQLSALTKKQKISFLRHLKAQHEEAIKWDIGNPIMAMDHALSSI